MTMIAGGYTKLFGSLIGSTLWRTDDKCLKIVWITMLAMANKHGEVMTSIPGLADFAKVSLEECLTALKTLKEPDQYSRTPDNEGRRIEDIPGGWRILNFLKYRDTMDEDDRRAYFREKQREYRSAKKKNSCNSTSPSTRPSGPATAEPSTSTEPPSPSAHSQHSSPPRPSRRRRSNADSLDNGSPTASTEEPAQEQINQNVPPSESSPIIFPEQ